MAENTIMDSDYITLHQATKFCSYSQDYLNLRARQKKLKAIKIGRNWVTTREWLDEYAKQVEQWNSIIGARKQSGAGTQAIPGTDAIDLEIDLKAIENRAKFKPDKQNARFEQS